MVLKHDLHRAKDRGGLGFKPTQAPGNFPESRDPGAPKAKNGSEGGGVHGQRVYIKTQFNGLDPSGKHLARGRRVGARGHGIATPNAVIKALTRASRRARSSDSPML